LVNQVVNVSKLDPTQSRALDLGCALGRTTFELSKYCLHVVGVDDCPKAIGIAERIRQGSKVEFTFRVEGDISSAHNVVLPAGSQPKNVDFIVSDFDRVPRVLGIFDVVLVLDLIDSQANPQAFLDSVLQFVKPGGQLLISSLNAWSIDRTPRVNWLGGYVRGAQQLTTLNGLKLILVPDFELVKALDMPLIVRKHARDYKLLVPQVTLWQKK
jgi:SAM-dependent methyltransferase